MSKIKNRDKLGRIKSSTGIKGKIRKTCLQCGKKFMVYPYRIKTAKFCSLSCKSKLFYPKILGNIDHSHLLDNKFRLGKFPWNKGKKFPEMSGKYHPRYVELIKLTCKNCEQIFFRKPWQCKRQNKKLQQFCSRQCVCEYYIKTGFLRKISSIKRIPSQPETNFINICQEYQLPFKYVGNGKFWIENLNPDFIDINGKKVIVEIFSSYFHNAKKNKNFRINNSEEFRKKVFARYGWRTIFFWDYEIKPKIILKRLMKDGYNKVSIQNLP